MTFRALRTKKSPKEFVILKVENNTLVAYTCGLPDPRPITATIQGMKDYFKSQELEFLDGCMNWDDFEMIEYEMFEINTEIP